MLHSVKPIFKPEDIVTCAVLFSPDVSHRKHRKLSNKVCRDAPTAVTFAWTTGTKISDSLSMKSESFLTRNSAEEEVSHSYLSKYA